MVATTGRMESTTRERIPVVALALFAEQGYEATSMRQIAEQLDITKAALYYHFASKEDIVRAVVQSTMDQIAGLVEWAKAQAVTPALRREVLDRWADILQAHGVAMFRFMMANRQLMQDIHPDKSGVAAQMSVLHAILTPPDASVEDQLKVRLALMSITLAGVAGADLEASEDEVLAAARRISVSLLPAGVLDD